MNDFIMHEAKRTKKWEEDEKYGGNAMSLQCHRWVDSASSSKSKNVVSISLDFFITRLGFLESWKRKSKKNEAHVQKDIKYRYQRYQISFERKKEEGGRRRLWEKRVGQVTYTERLRIRGRKPWQRSWNNWLTSCWEKVFEKKRERGSRQDCSRVWRTGREEEER